jgi:mitochondrial fission protein ELM1
VSAGAIWGLTDGSAGMVAQVRALAAALGRPVVMKTIRVRKSVAWLPNGVHGAVLRPFIFPRFLAPGSDDLTAPWPDLVVSCGRRAGLVAAGMRAKRGDARTRFIHVQDPQMSPRHFDLVVAMAHDRVQGANVNKTVIALHAEIEKLKAKPSKVKS